jgi:hypothetical protein
VVAVSDLALIGCARAAFRSLVQDGIKPQRSRSSRRSPVPGWRRITMALFVGAMFQLGAVLGTGPDVPNNARIASCGK